LEKIKYEKEQDQMDKQQQIQKRRAQFERWWRKNHTNKRAHHWLTKHTKRVMTDYNIAPEAWDQCKAILKRYNLSEYKRLHSGDALILWRITHPLPDEKYNRLLTTAMFFEEQRSLLKAERKRASA
jgi:hypothetical protein